MRSPKFKINDKVYHVTPDSREGIVTNIIYYYRSGNFVYEVCTGFGEEFYCKEEELSHDKIF